MYRQMTPTLLVIFGLASWADSGFAAAIPRAARPVIASATVDADKHIMVVSGQHFGGGLPVVALGDRVLNPIPSRAWGAVTPAATGGAPLCEGAESLPPVVTVYATGLDDPRGMTFGPDETLYVTEAGVGGTISTADQCPQTPSPFGPFSGGYTGRVSRILPDGTRTTVVDGLPSAQTSPLSGNAILGPEEVVFLDGILYVLLQAGGCETSTPDIPRAILRIEPDGSISLVANLSTWLRDNPTAGPPDNDTDPAGVPTSLVVRDSTFYVLEGNRAQLLEVTLDGAIHRVADLSVSLGHLTFTALELGPGNHFTIGNFGEVLYPDGSSKLWRVSTGRVPTEVADGLTTVIDIRRDCRHQLYVLESPTGNTAAPPFLVPGSGRVRRWIGDSFETVVEGLVFPTAMTFGPDGALYVTDFGYFQGTDGGYGRILRIEMDGRSGRARCRKPARPRGGAIDTIEHEAMQMDVEIGG